MEKINIVSSTNNNYVSYLIPMLVSLAENSKDTNILAHILYENLSEQNIKIIEEKIQNYKNINSIKFYKIDKYLFKNAILETYAKSSYEAYSRLLIPDLLPNIEKIIYIDADTIILKNIKLLNDIDLKDYSIAAVEDFNPNSKLIFKNIFNLKKVTSYFNSGILVMNLKELRKIKFSEQALKFIQETSAKYKFFDQDILNYIFSENYLKLDPRWNIQLYLELATSKYQHSTLSKEQYVNCKKNPYIIHYTIVKPDYLNYFFKYKNKYLEYLKKSNINFAYKKTSLKQIVWSLSEIIFFKIINTLDLKSREKVLNWFRKFF